MADEQTTTAETTDTAQADGQSTEGERKFSQAEVDALVKQTKDSTFAEARRTLKPKRQDEARTEKAALSDKGEDREARREAMSDAIADAVSDYGLSKEQSRTLRDLIRGANPEDPAAWVKTMVETFRPAKSPTTETVTVQPKETPVAQREPGDHPGPPQGAPPWERPTDPYKWTEAQVQQLVAQKGPREANRIIRQKAEQFARTMRIQMSPVKR